MVEKETRTINKILKKNLIENYLHERKIIDNFRINYSSFLNQKNNKFNFDKDLMKLIFTDVTILISEIFSLKKKINKKTFLQRIKILQKIPKGKSYFFLKILRYLKSLFYIDNFYKPKLFFHSQESLTFSPTDLLISYFKKKKKKFYLSNFNEWFIKKKIRIQDSDRELSKFIENIYKRNLFCFSKREINKLSNIFFINTSLLVAWYRQHKEHIEKQKTPLFFYSGTMGIPLNRLFAYGVKKNKGKVVVFDHGMGSGYFKTDLDCSYEFDFADKFVTFGPYEAKGMVKNSKISFKFRGNQSNKTKVDWATTLIKNSGSGKKIINFDLVYVTSKYIEDSSNLEYFYPDNLLIPFQRKIIRNLQKQKMKFALKPHPDSSNLIINKVSNGLKVNIINNNFNEISWSKQIIIFDSPNSTAFKTALRLDLPIILFSFPRLKLHAEALNLLKKRCKIVNINLNKDDQIDFKELNFFNLIKEAKFLSKNKLFINKYFPFKKI